MGDLKDWLILFTMTRLVRRTLGFCNHTTRIKYPLRPSDIANDIIRMYNDKTPHGELEPILDI